MNKTSHLVKLIILISWFVNIANADIPANTIFLDEGDSVAKWTGISVSYLRPIKGKVGAIWRGADGLSGASAELNLSAAQENFSGYKTLRFWAYSAAATNKQILVTLTSPGINGNGDYYYHYMAVDWVGWNFVNIPFTTFRVSRKPTGFHKITKIGIHARGWAPLTPKPGTQLTFDRIALSKSETFPDASAQLPAMTVFNALGEFAAPNGPALPQFESKLGFKCIRLALPGNRYDIVKRSFGAQLAANQIQQNEIMALARDLAKYNPNCIIALDLEHWKLSGAKTQAESLEVANNIRMLGVILDWMHAATPSLKLGYYGLNPLRDYWRAIRGPNDADYKAWQVENNALASVAAKSDVLFPSVYTFYNDPKGWSIYAMANISEARRFNRPIYPFIWPTYHDSTPLRGTRIDGDFWKFQLETLQSQNVAGVVMWDWAVGANGQKMYWNPLEPWWMATLGFLFP